MIGRGLGFLFSFVTPLILVRALDQSIFGQYKQFFLIAMTVAQAAALGLPASLFYFLPGGGDRRGRYVTSTLVALAVLGLAVVAALPLLGPSLAHLLSAPELAEVLPHLAVFALLTLISQPAEQLAVIEQRPRTAAVVALSSEVLRGALIIAGALIYATLHGIAWAAVVYGLMRVTFLLAYGAHLYGWSLFNPSWRDLRRQLAYALPFGMAAIVEAAFESIHHYYVAGSVEPAVYAIYAIGCFTVPGALVLYAAIADVALVRTTEYYKADQHAWAHDLFRTVIRVLGAFFIPSYLFVVTYAPRIVEFLFTSQYAAAAPILMIFSASLLLWSTDHVVLRAYAQTRFIMAAMIIGLAVHVGLLVPLYSALGLVGACLSYLVGLAVVRLLGLIRVRQLFSVPFRSLLPGRALALTALSAAVSAAISWAAVRGLSVAVSLFAGAAIYGAIYVFLAWVLGVITVEDKQRLRNLLLRWLSPASTSRV